MPKHFNKQRLSQLLDILQPERKTRIVDVGANLVNESPYKDLLDAGACEVWGFEPLADAFAELQKINSESEHYLPYAIGDGLEHELHVCRSGAFSSLLKPNTEVLDYLGRWHRAMRVLDKVALQTHKLDDLHDVPEPDLLKIDVQGSELAVFKSGRQKLSRTVSIITEIAFLPLYENQPLLHDQMAELETQGFGLHKFMFLKGRPVGSPLVKTVNPKGHGNQLLDGDAVFVRNLVDAETYSDEQLTHLAICSDAVFESFDLALKCVSILVDRGAVSESGAETYASLVPHQKK